MIIKQKKKNGTKHYLQLFGRRRWILYGCMWCGAAATIPCRLVRLWRQCAGIGCCRWCSSSRRSRIGIQRLAHWRRRSIWVNDNKELIYIDYIRFHSTKAVCPNQFNGLMHSDIKIEFPPTENKSLFFANVTHVAWCDTGEIQSMFVQRMALAFYVRSKNIDKCVIPKRIENRIEFLASCAMQHTLSTPQKKQTR